MAASSGGSLGSATYKGSSLPAGGVLLLRRCCCLCGVDNNTNSSRVGERGRSLEGGSFTLLSLPTGDDASLNGDGDLERLRREPRLTTESSRAMSAAHESQSIAAARLPFTASWVSISPVTWCAWSGAAPRGARSAPRKAFEAAAALPEFIELMDGREAMGPSHGSYGARRRGRSATGALLIASGFHHSLPTGGVRNCALRACVRHRHGSATIGLPRARITHPSRSS